MSSKKLISILLIFGFFWLSFSYGRSENKGPGNAPDIKKANFLVKEYFPGAVVLNTKDVYTDLECPHLTHPGFSVGDFKGNGEMDCAVLLKVGSSREFSDKDDGGKVYKYTVIKMWLVVFVPVGQGEFKPIVLEKMDEPCPTLFQLDVMKKGEELVALEEKTPSLKLENAGIELNKCGKFISVYYWDEKANKFQNYVESE